MGCQDESEREEAISTVFKAPSLWIRFVCFMLSLLILSLLEAMASNLLAIFVQTTSDGLQPN